jgi:hypothetical protein
VSPDVWFAGGCSGSRNLVDRAVSRLWDKATSLAMTIKSDLLHIGRRSCVSITSTRTPCPDPPHWLLLRALSPFFARRFPSTPQIRRRLDTFISSFISCKNDGPPGNTVLWRGITHFADINLGVELGKKFVGN